MKNTPLVIAIVAAIGLIAAIVFLVPKPVVPPVPTIKEYQSSELGISFSYPSTYFVVEMQENSEERLMYSIVLVEDTPENRALVAGEHPGTEAPPVITLGIFQNDLDAYTADTFITDNSFSNFKLSDGELTESTVGGERALRYHATGLYENENAVVARSAFVYMFTGFYNAPTDQIRSDFEALLGTVKFL